MASSFVGNGLGELRNALSSPGDNLYRHLTDLIVALDESGDKLARNGEADNSGKKIGIPAGRIIDQNPSGQASMMDTSNGPLRRRVRKRRRRREGAIAIDYRLAVGTGIPSSTVEISVSHSPAIYTSDSSDKNGTAVETRRMAVGSDSEIERLPHGCGTAEKSVVNPKLEIGDKLHIQAMNRLLHPGAALLSSALTQGVIESDSVTETVTPARYSNQRRRRLIKRMIIDQPQEQGMSPDAKRQTIAMDVDTAPHFVKGLLPFSPATGKAHVASYSEDSIDCNACSWIWSSDTDDGHSSDGGRQGDDEQSDWYQDLSYNGQQRPSEEIMGIPDLKESVQLSGAKSVNLDSSDTDMSQSSSSIPSRRLVSKNGALFCGALNRRILQFLRDPSETELSLGELRKKERKEALRLAIFYHLDVRREESLGCHCYILCKTKYSQWID